MCLQPSPAYVTLPPNVRPIYGRLAWLDELRLLAILVMVLDHTLLCHVGARAAGAERKRRKDAYSSAALSPPMTTSTTRCSPLGIGVRRELRPSLAARPLQGLG